jgi:hypothetical protein
MPASETRAASFIMRTAFVLIAVALTAPLCVDRSTAASDTVAGVRVTVRAGAWSANPANLEEFFTPVRVAIRNGSDHPLRIRYSELVIRSPALDFEPLPPRKLVRRDVELRSEEAVLVPRFEHSGFRIAGHYVPSFSELRPWDYPFDADGPWYERQYLRWTGSLPTVEMIETALPEGVLEPGGELAGFLYYPDLDAPRKQELRFEADLIDARTALSFGQIVLPLPETRRAPSTT